MSLLRTITHLTDALADVREDQLVSLADVQGIVFLRLTKLGCIVTIRGGHGLVLFRDADNKWGAPMALEFGGVALGADIGFEKSEFVCLFKNQETAISFMEGNASLGLNGTFTLGPVGINAEIMTNTGAKEAISVIGRSVGLYGGVSLEISGVKPDKRANMTQYGQRVEVSDLVDGRLEIPQEFSHFYLTLNKEEEHSVARKAERQAAEARAAAEAKEAAAAAVAAEAERLRQEVERMNDEVKDAQAAAQVTSAKAVEMVAKAAQEEATAKKQAAEDALRAAELKSERAARAADQAVEKQKQEVEQAEKAEEATRERKQDQAAELLRQAQLAEEEMKKLRLAAEQAQAELNTTSAKNKEPAAEEPQSPTSQELHQADSTSSSLSQQDVKV